MVTASRQHNRLARYSHRESVCVHFVLLFVCAPLLNRTPMQVVDLTGDREFFTRESAERALAPLFKPASAITRVSYLQATSGWR